MTGGTFVFDAITIEVQLGQDGQVAISYLLSGKDTPTKIRRSRLSTETVEADVARVLAYAVPLLASQPIVAASSKEGRSLGPNEFDNASQLDVEMRANAFASLTRIANATS
jgi:hypothetical protein